MKNTFLVLSLLLTCTAQQVIANADDAAKRMEDLIQEQIGAGLFSGSVLVAKGSTPLFERSYGYSDLASKKPFTAETRFQIGSVTKQFTAAALLLLQERGKLRVTDSVRSYLPSAPAAWEKVTLLTLLSHTSGIPEYTDLPGFIDTVNVPVSPEALLARFEDKPLDFEPGSKWRYSNSGYIVLGVVIAKVSGKTWGAFVSEDVLAPCGMLNTGYQPDIHGANDATGYSTGKVATPMSLSVAYAAGGLQSTPRDLLQWQQCLYGGKLLSPRSLKSMTTPIEEHYGMGVSIETRYWHFLKMLFGIGGTQLIEHGGATAGFSSHLAFYPEQRMTVVVLSNIQSDAPLTLARRLATVAFNEPDWAPIGSMATP